MQFLKGGPDIPERLLQAHEDGRVVFFCGAGISYPAGLPGFQGLVEELYSRLEIAPNPVQAAAIKDKRYDTAVDLLERNIVGGREVVRERLAQILEADTSLPNATSTHRALLTLGKCRERRTRLITTNFDRLFEHVISHGRDPVKSFEAPLLPVPKNRWDGLVYLHGLLPEYPVGKNLDNLVVSRGREARVQPDAETRRLWPSSENGACGCRRVRCRLRQDHVALGTLADPSSQQPRAASVAGQARRETTR